MDSLSFFIYIYVYIYVPKVCVVEDPDDRQAELEEPVIAVKAMAIIFTQNRIVDPVHESHLLRDRTSGKTVSDSDPPEKPNPNLKNPDPD